MEVSRRISGSLDPQLFLSKWLEFFALSFWNRGEVMIQYDGAHICQLRYFFQLDDYKRKHHPKIHFPLWLGIGYHFG